MCACMYVLYIPTYVGSSLGSSFHFDGGFFGPARTAEVHSKSSLHALVFKSTNSA